MLLSATPTSSALKLLAQRRQLHTINTAPAGFVVTAIKASSGGQQVWCYMCVFMERQGYVRLLSSKFFMITMLYSLMGEPELMCHTLMPQGCPFTTVGPLSLRVGWHKKPLQKTLVIHFWMFLLFCSDLIWIWLKTQQGQQKVGDSLYSHHIICVVIMLKYRAVDFSFPFLIS